MLNFPDQGNMSHFVDFCRMCGIIWLRINRKVALTMSGDKIDSIRKTIHTLIDEIMDINRLLLIYHFVRVAHKHKGS